MDNMNESLTNVNVSKIKEVASEPRRLFRVTDPVQI
jgi:hypothetical protein